MGLNFPSSPVNGQYFRPGNGVRNYRYFAANNAWYTKAGTALPKNLLVNPAGKVIQAPASAAAASNAGYYSSENWKHRWSVSAPGLLVANTYDDAVSHSYPFHANLIYFYVSTALATIGAADYAVIEQRVEGYRCVDLLWGHAAAKPAVLRFTMLATPGVYSVSIYNAALNKGWYSNFTYAGGYQEFVFSIPPCTDGTWLTDNGVGLYLAIGAAIGSNFRDPSDRQGQWLNAAYLGGPGQSNNTLAAVVNIGIFAPGLYVDPNHTGLAPPFELPAYEDDLADTQRYYQKIYGMRGVASTPYVYAQSVPVVPMRTTPAYALSSPAPVLYDISTSPLATAVSAAMGNERQHYIALTAASALVTGRPAGTVFNAAGDTTRFIAANARL